MENEEFLIHELAERSGVTVRTIRFYSDQGLLPPPILRGKYAYYTPAHLRRLELIRQMKDSYLPLRDIRDMVSTMSDDELQEKLAAASAPRPLSLAEPPAVSPPSPGRMELRSDAEPSGIDRSEKKIAEGKSGALDYIARLVEQQSDLRTTTQRRLSSRERTPQPSLFGEDPTAGEPWRRFELAPGIELHVREPIDPRTLHIVKQIIDYAHKMLQTKRGG
jgi:DNA-binding transcriptional MerR regulator